MEIYLMRHGQTTSDIEDRFGGDYDDHLTSDGEKQAKALGKKLQNSGIEVLFVSSRIRAQETAIFLNEKLKVEVVTDPDLRERNLYGPLTGMVKAEAKEKFPEYFERIKNVQDTIPGAEHWKDFVDRVVASFQKISKMNYKTVGIMTHSGPIRRIFYGLLGTKPEEGDMKVDDCAFALIEVNDGKMEIKKLDGIWFEK